MSTDVRMRGLPPTTAELLQDIRQAIPEEMDIQDPMTDMGYLVARVHFILYGSIPDGCSEEMELLLDQPVDWSAPEEVPVRRPLDIQVD